MGLGFLLVLGSLVVPVIHLVLEDQSDQLVPEVLVPRKLLGLPEVPLIQCYQLPLLRLAHPLDQWVPAGP